MQDYDLKDFKSYKDTVEIKFGGRFNVIIGENNIGKSTIFEALLLWEKCYNESLTSNKKNFYSQSVPLYISFDELYFLRITKDEDLFYGNKRTCEIGVEFSEENSEENFYLTFIFLKQMIKPLRLTFFLFVQKVCLFLKAKITVVGFSAMKSKSIGRNV